MEEIVQHSNLRVKWNLRKSGWNFGVAGKDPAQQGEFFPPCHEEEQEKSIWGLPSIYSSIKDVSSGISIMFQHFYTTGVRVSKDK